MPLDQKPSTERNVFVHDTWTPPKLHSSSFGDAGQVPGNLFTGNICSFRRPLTVANRDLMAPLMDSQAASNIIWFSTGGIVNTLYRQLGASKSVPPIPDNRWLIGRNPAM